VGKYVDLRVDHHGDAVNELVRYFKIWELTILEREDPSDVVKIEEVAEELSRRLALNVIAARDGMELVF